MNYKSSLETFIQTITTLSSIQHPASSIQHSALGTMNYKSSLETTIDTSISGFIQTKTNDEFPMDIVKIIADNTLDFNRDKSASIIRKAWIKYHDTKYPKSSSAKCDDCGTWRREGGLKYVNACHNGEDIYCCRKMVCINYCLIRCNQLQCMKKFEVPREFYKEDGRFGKCMCPYCDEVNIMFEYWEGPRETNDPLCRWNKR